jgi:hypothetical protein
MSGVRTIKCAGCGNDLIIQENGCVSQCGICLGESYQEGFCHSEMMYKFSGDLTITVEAKDEEDYRLWRRADYRDPERRQLCLVK